MIKDNDRLYKELLMFTIISLNTYTHTGVMYSIKCLFCISFVCVCREVFIFLWLHQVVFVERSRNESAAGEL
jgi:hypothetical protein